MLQFTDDDILEITREGITLRTPNGDIKISFSECKQNFAFENSLTESNCVATRNITIPSFIFFSNPKIEIIFKKKSFLQHLFSVKRPYSEFHELQKTIQRTGYTTYDMS